MEIRPMNEVSKPSAESNSYDPDKRIDVNRNQDSKNNTGYDPDKRVEKNENRIVEGGAYSEVKKNSDGDTHEVNHMPSDSASYLETKDGPAIKMEKADHFKTASWGASKEAKEYRAEQKRLIDEGKFREALQMDIDDIHEKFGDKYDNAIAEMLVYVDKLESEGKI